MSIQQINNGDTGLVVRNALNANFRDLSVRPGQLITPRFIFAGDSKAALAGGLHERSFAKWALWLSGIEYLLNPALDNCGVSGQRATTETGAATNGSGVATTIGFASDTNVGVIVGRVQAAVAAGENPVLWIQLGTNSTGSENATLAAIRKAVNACRNAGAVMFLINEIPPYVLLTATTAGNVGSQNTIMRRFCEAQTDCHFIEHGFATLNTTSTTSAPFGTTSVAGSPILDGVHESELGAYLEGKMMAPQLARIFRRAAVRYSGPGDQYQAWFGAAAFPTAGLGANLIRNPLFAGTGGQDVTVKNDTSSVTGSVPDRWRLEGTLNGNVNIAFTTIVNDYLNALTGRRDLTCLRMTFSGTPTADINFIFRNTDVSSPSSYPAIPNGTYSTIGQMIMRFNALATIQDIEIRCGYNSRMGNAGAGTSPANRLPALTETIFANGRDPANVTVTGGGISTAGPPGNGLYLRLPSGVPCSGSVDFIYADCRLKQPFPAPLA